jgi:hypothetical protein
MGSESMKLKTGAYYDAETLSKLSEALEEARLLFESAGTPVTEKASVLIEDAQRLLEMPRLSKVQLGPTDDIHADDLRNFLEKIVGLFTVMSVDKISLSELKTALDYRGISISFKLDLLETKGYIMRENEGQSYDKRFIYLTEKTKALTSLAEPETTP